MNRLCLCFALLPLVLSAHDHSSPHISVGEYQPPQEAVIVGQGDFRYQMVPGWGMQNANGIKLGHCQAVAEDRQGRILLLNTSEEHCMLILGTDGGLLDIWGVRQTHR
jgi:hypothetical protein